MNTSIILAKLLGPYCVIVALSVFFNLKTYQNMMADFFKNSAVVYMAGILALIVGLIMIQFHNIWVYDWPTIITVMGWLSVVKGVRLIAFPNSLPSMMAFYQNKPNYLLVRLVLIFLLGIMLILFGYFKT